MATYSPLSAERIMRDNSLQNVVDIFDAAQSAALRLPAACALMEQESHGANIYGNDKGGVFSGFPQPVDHSNYVAYRWLVSQGGTPNGVGPAQLTFTGFLDDMEKKGMRPWIAKDNMVYGFDLLEEYYAETHSWIEAGKRYNGSTTYGQELAAKVTHWHTLLAPARL